MIETIYSNENNEAEGTSTTQTTFKMPKNIRQVGKGNAAKKIYVEDYVMTFIKQLAGGDYSGYNIAVLVGQCIKIDNCRNIFISGAVEVKNTDASGEIIFTNDTWTGIYEDIKRYFVETEIVGWFIGGPGYLLSEDDKILKTHVDNFAGQDKILLTYDNMEKEEAFLSYENNHLSKHDGYYIYYEKNEEMQSYIIDHKQSEESFEANYNDKVSKDIRTVLQNKKQPEEESKSVTRLMYAAGTLLAVIVLIVGAAMLRNYDQMKSMQDTLNYLSKNMEEVQAIFADSGDADATTDTASEDTQAGDLKETSSDAATTEDGLDVEVVPGNVEPIVEDANTSDSENSKDSKEDDDAAATDKELAKDATDDAKATDTDTSDTKASDTKASDTKASDTKTDTTAKNDSTKTTKEEVKYYTVKEGDTLAGISFKLYNTYTKVKTIMTLNEIDDQDVIFVGQKLIVP